MNDKDEIYMLTGIAQLGSLCFQVCLHEIRVVAS